MTVTVVVVGDQLDADVTAAVAAAPRRPLDIARFSSNTLFGQPGIYPDGPPMEPATGTEHSDASLETVMSELVGTVGEPVVAAFTEGRTPIRRLAYGVPALPGRIVGPTAADDRHVVNQRYRAEDPRMLLPSIVHALLWSGPGAGHAEETLLHALGAYVHAQLLARDPALGTQTTELARRQSSITITLLNSRQPGSAVVTLVAPDGPGTIPGGAPAMQSADFWSVPFGPRTGDGSPIGPLVRSTLAAAAGVDASAAPTRFDDALGAWCSDHLVHVLTRGSTAPRSSCARVGAVTAHPPRSTPTPRRRLGSLVIVLCVVNVLVAADFLGASVLLDAVGRDLQMTTADLAWVVNGYLLTLAAPLIAFGRAADSFGAVRLTRLGLVSFALGALLAGVADSAELLVVGRMIQGLGASALTATGLSLVSTSAAPDDRGRVVGIWAGVGAVGSAAGPLVAGALEALGSWRIFFLVDVPFALAVLWFLRRQADATVTEPRKPVGLLGVVTLTGGLGAAVFALLAGPDDGWTSPSVVAPAVGAVVLLATFVRAERRDPAPLLDPKLFAHGRYPPIACTAFVGNAAFAVVSFFASLYLQQVEGLDPVVAGVVFLAMTIPLIALSPIAGRWTRRASSCRLMAGGLVVVAVSVAMFAVLGASGGLGIVIGALVLTGAGQAVVFNVSNIAAVGGGGAAGLESGVINEVRQLGALIGLAVFGALFSALQRGSGQAAALAFAEALRAPSLLLAGVCVATAVVVACTDVD